MEIIEKLQQYASTYSVLYVEDDEIIRTQVLDFLKRFFKKITVAEDGQEGLEKFKRVQPNLVISDIQMPKMDGLEMVANIKEIDKSVPIIISTAYNDQSYFMESIRLGIARYVLKPIDLMDFSQVLMDVFVQMDDQEKARAYEKKLLQEKLQSNAQQIIANLANSYPMPTLVFKQGQLIFLNDAFATLLDETTLKKVESDPRALDLILLHKNGYAHSLFDPDHNMKVLIPSKQGHKVFQIYHHTMNSVDDAISTQVIVLGDVTHLEQRRQSQRNYNRYLQEMIKNETDVRDFDTAKNRILREEHKKVLANEYISKLKSDALEEAGEFKKRISNAERLLERYAQQTTQRNMEDLILGLEGIVNALSILDPEFEELKEAILDVNKALKESVSDELLNIMVEYYLSNIFNDLKSWHQDVFVHQSSEDIHSHDVDILSGCIDFQFALFQGEKADFLLEGPGITL